MSNTKLRSALFSVNALVGQIKNYAYASQADIRHMLHRTMKDLHQLGYNIGHLQGLKPKHIHALVAHWKQQNKNPATIKNYMSKLRKVSALLDKPALVKPSKPSHAPVLRSHRHALDLISNAVDQAGYINSRQKIKP